MSSQFSFHIIILILLLGVNNSARGQNATKDFDEYDEMFRFYVEGFYNSSTSVNNRQVAYELYSMNKLWNEDTCGHKMYRSCIAHYLKSSFDSGSPKIKVNDIIKVLGIPDFRDADKSSEHMQYFLLKDDKCLSPITSVHFFFKNNILDAINIDLAIYNDHR